ncbi:hypothetical protein [Streptomyces sp. NPDC059761]|uniref:hypothetical protein n=1 Tax=Streptomyces sp. NPDC059761 TaxID=3346937 RepID=UPI003661BA31
MRLSATRSSSSAELFASWVTYSRAAVGGAGCAAIASMMSSMSSDAATQNS